MILGSFAAAAVILAAFVAVEARSSKPMLPLRLFRRQLFTVSNMAMVVVGFGLMGSSFFFSQFFVSVQGSSVLLAGLQTLPASLGMVIVSPQEGGLASGISSTTRQIGAVLGVAVLDAIVHTRQSDGASFAAGLGSPFIAAGAVTLASAVFTGLWLANPHRGTLRGPEEIHENPG